MRAHLPIATTASWLLCIASSSAFAFGGQIAVGLNAANEVADIEVPFTADATLETAEFNINTKIYFRDGKIRDEFDMEGQHLAYITRPDQHVVWMVMPQGFYLEISLDDIEQNNAQQMQEYRLVEREVVGQEVVNGMQTTRYRVIYETKDGRYGGFTWFNENNIAVKAFMVSETDGERQRVNFEMTNLVVGPVDDGLFDLPPGARKLDVGGFGGSSDGGLFGGFDNPESQGDGAQADDESDFSDEVVDAAKQGAQDAAVEETRRGVQDAVSRGIRGLFRRN